jgi:hypothetical protein
MKFSHSLFHYDLRFHSGEDLIVVSWVMTSCRQSLVVCCLLSCSFEWGREYSHTLALQSPSYIFRIESTLKMEAADSSKTLLSTHQTMWCHNPEDHNLNLLVMKNIRVGCFLANIYLIAIMWTPAHFIRAHKSQFSSKTYSLECLLRCKIHFSHLHNSQYTWYYSSQYNT